MRPKPGIHAALALLALTGVGAARAQTIEQTAQGPRPPAEIVVSFDGLGEGFEGPQGSARLRNPSDNSVAVGPRHVVQIVNSRMAVFTRSGVVLRGPVPTNEIFAGFGGRCEPRPNGDAVVRYDQLADRWLVVMPIFRRDSTDAETPYSVCYAVSAGDDPLGPYHRYEFKRALFPDYPRPAVWPDGYYVPTSTGDDVIQKHVCIVDRARMLRGEPATEQCVVLDGVNFLNNADVDGRTPPPAGAPNLMMATGGAQLSGDFDDDGLYVWKVRVDWDDPARTSVTGPDKIEVAPYRYLCDGQLTNCVPQPGTDRRLDAQGDKLMQRLVYRNLGERQALVALHSVATEAGGGGVRWYELGLDERGDPRLIQQGTYAPDPFYRWMGSGGMDRLGNIAVGYSFGGAPHFPGQRLAGRLAGDPPGRLTLREAVLAEGGASQTGTLRWEDYTTLAMDPVDDCTFWYVGDYLKAGAESYSTRIGAFRLPGCAQRAPEAVQAEEATARAFDGLRGDPARLVAFLRAMPKGGDLHSHLSGAVYAESFLAWAAEDGRCVSVATLTVVTPPCDAAAGRPSAAAATADGALRERIVDAFSTRNYKPEEENGHERFFSTFGRFNLAGEGRTGDMVAEVSARAAAGGVRYLELMHTAAGRGVGSVATAAGWDDDWDRLRARLLAAGLRDTLAAASRAMDAVEGRRQALLRCGAPDPDAGCGVTVRYLYQVLRAASPDRVFAQILAGFELTRSDPRFVGLNLVQPEDDPVAMRDYALHMRIIRHLSALYPEVPVSLHAGELAEGLVPPEGLRFHLREAVEVAGARRVGHGVDVLHEDDPDALLRLMAERRVLVEINLTSNDVILGVRGARHPLRTYLAYGVPVALSTDDEGVSRSEMTLEYRRAVEEQGVDYPALKAMARNSLEHAFVEGGSLWRDYATLLPVEACAAESGGLEGPSCAAFLAANTRARLQASLETDLAGFEARVAAGSWPVRIR